MFALWADPYVATATQRKSWGLHVPLLFTNDTAGQKKKSVIPLWYAPLLCQIQMWDEAQTSFSPSTLMTHCIVKNSHENSQVFMLLSIIFLYGSNQKRSWGLLHCELEKSISTVNFSYILLEIKLYNM